jgi:hypothetical protein
LCVWGNTDGLNPESVHSEGGRMRGSALLRYATLRRMLSTNVTRLLRPRVFTARAFRRTGVSCAICFTRASTLMKKDGSPWMAFSPM